MRKTSIFSMAKGKVKRFWRKISPFIRIRRVLLARRTLKARERIREIDRKIDLLTAADAQIKVGGPIAPSVERMAGRKAERHTRQTWRKLIKGEIHALEVESQKASIEWGKLRQQAKKLET